MADQTLQQTGSTSRQTGKSSGSADNQQNLHDQAVAAGREFKEKAADLAEASGEKLKEQASQFADAAKDVAAQATDRLKDTISEQKGAGADYIGNLAATIRRAASEFDDDLPVAGKYIRTAAAQVENVSESLRTGEFKDLISNAQSFARRQPTAFLGLAALAGFVAVRFLKSSPQTSSDNGGQEQRSRSEYRG
jgi:ElaB/YqjD/DUF883 family membrane-anchored ribosome-binding protein